MFEPGSGVRGSAADALSAAIDGLAGIDLDTMADSALAEELILLSALQSRLSAQILRRIAVFDNRGISRARGLPTSLWLRNHTHCNPGTARRTVQLAQRLFDDDTTARALADGTITPEHAHVIHDALLALPDDLDGQHRTAIHESLLTQARLDHPKALKGLADRIRAHCDPDGADLDAQHAHERRWLDVSTTYRGMVSIRGMLDAEAGLILQTALNTLTRPTGPDDHRPVSTRRADALLQLAMHSLEHGDLPDTNGVKPHIAITIPAEHLATGRGSGTVPDHPDLPLTTRTVRRWLCDAAVTRIVLTPTGQPLDIGRETRVIPPALRKAVTTRDKHCIFPGCHAPPPGATPTTSNTGPTAAKRACTISFCCAANTTPTCTKSATKALSGTGKTPPNPRTKNTSDNNRAHPDRHHPRSPREAAQHAPVSARGGRIPAAA